MNDDNNNLSFLSKTINGDKLPQIVKTQGIGLNDFNNFEGSNRKLVVNERYEYWVHDELLTCESVLLKLLLKDKDEILMKKHKLVEEKYEYEGRFLIKTAISFNQSEWFFDILLWMYGKDNERLLASGDEVDSFLSLISLGRTLQLKEVFFELLIDAFEVVDFELFKHKLWSRFCIDFSTITKILRKSSLNTSSSTNTLNNLNSLSKQPSTTFTPQTPTTSFKILFGLLSWLREKSSLDETSINKDLELYNSSHLSDVQQYIKANNLMESINISELETLKTKFQHLIPILHIEFIVQKHILKQVVKITCRVCKRISNNIQDFNVFSCESKLYHPRSLATYQRQYSNQYCEHENCKKKFNINEFPCCHRGTFSEGCIMSDGSHVIVIEMLS